MRTNEYKQENVNENFYYNEKVGQKLYKLDAWMIVWLYGCVCAMYIWAFIYL